MKLFKIELDNVGYDDYNSCVIVAESKEQVEELCKIYVLYSFVWYLTIYTIKQILYYPPTIGFNNK